MPTETRARRLKPEERTAQILDCAAALIASAGVSGCTIEAVSRLAEVTPQLVHSYFGTRQSLLESLYRRKQERFRASITQSLQTTTSFEDVVRVFVGANVDHLGPRSALGALQAAPELAAMAASDREVGSKMAGRLLVEAMRSDFPAPTKTITRILTMGSGASIAAAELAARNGSDRQETIDETVRFIMGGLDAVLEVPA